MVIICQDKVTIVNYDNVKAITITDNEINYRIMAWVDNNTKVILGTYLTLKRAQEVLQEIIDNISIKNENSRGTFEACLIKILAPNVLRFEMPQE